MAPANKQDDESESTSNVSSFETHYASQPIEFPNLDTLEIDKRLRSNGIGASVRTEKYGETFFMSRFHLLQILPHFRKARFWRTALISRKDYAN